MNLKSDRMSRTGPQGPGVELTGCGYRMDALCVSHTGNTQGTGMALLCQTRRHPACNHVRNFSGEIPELQGSRMTGGVGSEQETFGVPGERFGEFKADFAGNAVADQGYCRNDSWVSCRGGDIRVPGDSGGREFQQGCEHFKQGISANLVQVHAWQREKHWASGCARAWRMARGI